MKFYNKMCKRILNINLHWYPRIPKFQNSQSITRMYRMYRTMLSRLNSLRSCLSKASVQVTMFVLSPNLLQGIATDISLLKDLIKTKAQKLGDDQKCSSKSTDLLVLMNYFVQLIQCQLSPYPSRRVDHSQIVSIEHGATKRCE